MKRGKKFGLGILVVLVIILVVLSFALNTIVRTGVVKFAPLALGVPVSLEDVDIRPVRGLAILHGLKVGNPEGYKSTNLFEVERVEVRLQLASLLSDTIHIRKIEVDAPVITFEGSLRGNNISTLLHGIEERGAGGTNAPAEGSGQKPAPGKAPPTAGEPATKIIIDEFILKDPRAKLTIAELGMHDAPLALPGLTLRDIGKDSGGASPAEVANEIVAAIAKSLSSVIGKSVDVIDKSLKKLTSEDMKDAANSAADGASKALKDIGNLFKGKRGK